MLQDAKISSLFLIIHINFVLTIVTRVLCLYWFDWDNFSPVGVGFSHPFFDSVILQA